ncbi:MAG: F0F1 ATP synthase subunit A [Evtepia sp.]
MLKMNCDTAFTIPLFGGIPIPESVAVTWIVMAFLVIASIALTRNLKIVPTSKSQTCVEILVGAIYRFLGGILGEDGKRYFPYLGTIILFLSVGNLTELVGMKPPTKDMNVTVALAFMSICLIEYSGWHKKGSKKFLRSFLEPMPALLPLNILEILIRPLSLCMRLFGNVFGTFVVMEMIKLLIPVIIPIPFSMYFDVFDGLVQMYIFVLLTSLFMKESLDD